MAIDPEHDAHLRDVLSAQLDDDASMIHDGAKQTGYPRLIMLHSWEMAIFQNTVAEADCSLWTVLVLDDPVRRTGQKADCRHKLGVTTNALKAAICQNRTIFGYQSIHTQFYVVTAIIPIAANPASRADLISSSVNSCTLL